MTAPRMISTPVLDKHEMWIEMRDVDGKFFQEPFLCSSSDSWQVCAIELEVLFEELISLGIIIGVKHHDT